MRHFITAVLLYIVLVNNQSYSQAKSNNNDPAIKMLQEFYAAYNTAWATANGNLLIKKLDSLQSQYCTLALRKELKKEFKKVGLDHDKLIDDDYTDVEHLNTIKVAIDSKVPMGYLVSYTVFAKDVSNNPTQEKIVIHVTVAKENGELKIASVR